MRLIIAVILFLPLVTVYLVMRFTLDSHLTRISLPGNFSNANKKIFNIFQTGGAVILLLAFVFLILTLI